MNPRRRYSQHYSGTSGCKAAWIKELRTQKKRPLFIVLAIVPASDADKEEHLRIWWHGLEDELLNKEPGRPTLFDVPVKNYVIALTPDMAAYLKDVGSGNRSEGVRMLIRAHGLKPRKR